MRDMNERGSKTREEQRTGRRRSLGLASSPPSNQCCSSSLLFSLYSDARRCCHNAIFISPAHSSSSRPASSRRLTWTSVKPTSAPFFSPPQLLKLPIVSEFPEGSVACHPRRKKERESRSESETGSVRRRGRSEDQRRQSRIRAMREVGKFVL